MITALTGFTAEAEIMGEIHPVRFQDEALIIDELELHEATEILRRLSDKSIAAVELPSEDETAPTPVPGKQEQEPQVPPPSVAKSESPPAAAPPAPPAPPVPPAAPSQSAPLPAAAAVTPPQGIPEEIAGAQRLRDVVDYLTQKQGLKTPEEVLAAVERYKPHSPTLQRATDVENRVKKILAGNVP